MYFLITSCTDECRVNGNDNKALALEATSPDFSISSNEDNDFLFKQGF